MTEEKQDAEVIQEELTKEQLIEPASESPQEVVEKISDPLERLSALQEMEVLAKLISTKYYHPKFSEGNGNKIKTKLTGSIELNYFDPKTMEKWGNRILELTEKLS